MMTKTEKIDHADDVRDPNIYAFSKGFGYYLKKSVSVLFILAFLFSVFINIGLANRLSKHENNNKELINNIKIIQSEKNTLKSELIKYQSEIRTQEEFLAQISQLEAEKRELEIQTKQLRTEVNKVSNQTKTPTQANPLGDLIVDKAVEEGVKRTFNFIFGE